MVLHSSRQEQNLAVSTQMKHHRENNGILTSSTRSYKVIKIYHYFQDDAFDLQLTKFILILRITNKPLYNEVPGIMNEPP